MVVENKVGTDRSVFKLHLSHSRSAISLLIIYLILLKLGFLTYEVRIVTVLDSGL